MLRQGSVSTERTDKNRFDTYLFADYIEDLVSTGCKMPPLSAAVPWDIIKTANRAAFFLLRTCAAGRCSATHCWGTVATRCFRQSFHH